MITGNGSCQAGQISAAGHNPTFRTSAQFHRKQPQFMVPIWPPADAPASGPPLSDIPDARAGDFDPHAQPALEYGFDQRLAW